MLDLLALMVCSQAKSNLYDSFVEKLRHSSTVSGRVVVTIVTRHKAIKFTDVFQFKLPNLSKIVTWDAGLSEEAVSDGITYWDYTATPSYLMKAESPPRFMLAGGYLLEPFLNQRRQEKVPEFVAVKSVATPISFHGRPALRIEIRRGDKDTAQRAKPSVVYMDPKTGIPMGVTLHSSTENRTVEYLYEELSLDKPIDSSVFTYQPQIAANTNQMDSLLPVGAKAPMFSGVALGEKSFDLASEMKGAKAVVLNFWGLGCGPCRAELARLQELQNRYATKGLKVFTFQPLDDTKILSSFMSQRHLNLMTVFEGSCKPSSVATAYRGAIGEPVTYLIDGKGTIAAHYMTDDVTQLTKDLASLGLKD